MATTSAIDLLIETSKSASNLKEIKQLSKEIKTAMLEMGDDGGEEFDKLARAAADLEDRVGEVKDRIDQMNPDKFSAIESAAKIGATGINLVTGAMGLLGDQSEDTQRALLKVQQAMAFAQGLSGIKDLEKDFKNLWKTISTNPLGIAVAVVSALVGALAALDAWITRDTENVKALTKAYEQQKKQTELLTIEKQHEIAILEAQGGQEEKVFERKKALMLLQLQEIKQSFDLHAARVKQIEDNDSLYEGYLKMSAAIFERMGLETAAQKSAELAEANKRERQADDRKAMEEDFQRFKQLENDLAVLQINETNRVAKINKDASDKREADHTASLKRQAEADELYRQQLLEAERRMTEQLAAEAELRAEDNERIRARQQADLDTFASMFPEALRGQQESAAEFVQGLYDRQLIDFVQYQKALTLIAKQEEDIRLASQYAFANAAIGMLSALEGLTKKGSAANKALALADIAAGTAVGFINALDIAQKSAKATGPAAAFAFPIFYASQVAAVLAAAARARDVLRGGNASGGGGSIGGGGGAFTAPNIAAINTEPAGTQPTTPIDANGNPIQTNNQPQGPQQVFVVETDITRTTGRVAVLENNLTLR